MYARLRLVSLLTLVCMSYLIGQ